MDHLMIFYVLKLGHVKKVEMIFQWPDETV